jgi:tetratricopeptide (TPR) repeat protein
MVNFKSLKDLMENYSGFDAEKNKVYGYLSGYESKTAEKTLNTSFSSELKVQAEIQKAFAEKDMDWWKKKIALLNTAGEKKDKTPSDYRDIRLLSYISMSCYMLVTASLKNNEIQQAQKYLSVYAMADPSNADVPYLYGVMHAQTSNFQTAIDSLSSALKKGYSDKTKWKYERAFIPLKDSIRFIDLESRLNAIL